MSFQVDDSLLCQDGAGPVTVSGFETWLYNVLCGAGADGVGWTLLAVACMVLVGLMVYNICTVSIAGGYN